MRIIFAFLLGMGVGALGLYFYLASPDSPRPAAATGAKISDSARTAANTAATRTREIAANVTDAIAEKIVAWHLTPDDIRADLAKTGQVVRDNTAQAKEKISDVRIVTVIKAKFVLDRELSVHGIEVESKDGNVTLGGSVGSENLVGKAVAHALDTEGVHHVVAKMAVRPRAP